MYTNIKRSRSFAFSRAEESCFKLIPISFIIAGGGHLFRHHHRLRVVAQFVLKRTHPTNGYYFQFRNDNALSFANDTTRSGLLVL